MSAGVNPRDLRSWLEDKARGDRATADGDEEQDETGMAHYHGRADAFEEVLRHIEQELEAGR